MSQLQRETRYEMPVALHDKWSATVASHFESLVPNIRTCAERAYGCNMHRKEGGHLMLSVFKKYVFQAPADSISKSWEIR